ncbi:MAG: heavy-metal-associated domain-containing protein [Planctomycetes bacterium]|nr:heavy-metal-associated domain-containing protein [Planctomycetota bacterium]
MALSGLSGVTSVEFELKEQVFRVGLNEPIPEELIRRAVEAAGNFKLSSVSKIDRS